MARNKTKSELANSRLLTVLTLAGAVLALALRTSAAPLEVAEIEPSARPQLSCDTISHPSGQSTGSLDQ